MTTTNERLTRSAYNFVGGIYEHAIDQRMNLLEIQAYLGKRGIHKPLLSIKTDLTHRYAFAGYVEAHPAPPRLTYAEADAEIRKQGKVKPTQQGVINRPISNTGAMYPLMR